MKVFADAPQRMAIRKGVTIDGYDILVLAK